MTLVVILLTVLKFAPEWQDFFESKEFTNEGACEKFWIVGSASLLESWFSNEIYIQGSGGRHNLNFQASIRGGFFEFLKHAKQDLSIIEFKNQVWNLLHKLEVWKGEFILILGSKIHNFLTLFLRSQNSARNSKIGF